MRRESCSVAAIRGGSGGSATEGGGSHYDEIEGGPSNALKQ